MCLGGGGLKTKCLRLVLPQEPAGVETVQHNNISIPYLFLSSYSDMHQLSGSGHSFLEQRIFQKS